MSSFICFSTDEFAVVATDTLGVDAEGNPFILTNKATYLPTIKTIICGTGMGGFHSRWAEFVNSRMILLDVDNLDYHAPSTLKDMWEEYKKEYNVGDECTVTIYHVGISQSSGRIKRFAYRSSECFRSEEITHGWFYKPECSVPDGEDILGIIKAMMFEQRAIQDAMPSAERVYIGGQVNVIILEKDSVRLMTIADFPDFSSVINKLFNL